ncbi:MAG: patatin-like phospholipase family protein [Rhodococcus sp. (in: high G+C Gram-positive bacteria)]|uniref:patatin-like phospholipase family protein n=1 Tax=Rhodococcus sp. TaxID=1831 RepID=UPI003BB496AA
MSTGTRIGLVVAGGGAKGAYEAGALSVLLPWMVDRGTRPSVLVGTSAGALNVVALGGLAHLDAREATEFLVDTWGTVRPSDVFGLTSGIGTGLRYAGQLAGLSVRIPSLLDPRRLRTKLAQQLPLEQLHRNIDEGLVDAVAVTTTSVTTGGTVVFLESNDAVDVPPDDPARNITYVRTELTVDHVLASAAVPLLFRPVRISQPSCWRGWYIDGGLRLNAPLVPAVELGCRTLGVVATQPLSSQTPRPPTGRASELAAPLPDGPPPDVYAIAALALRNLLADRMVEDIRLLGSHRHGENAVDIVFAGPPEHRKAEIAELADRVFRRYGYTRAVRSPELWMLTRLIGGAPEDHGNLLSYLFFDSEFTTRAAALGADHAAEHMNVIGDRGRDESR